MNTAKPPTFAELSARWELHQLPLPDGAQLRYGWWKQETATHGQILVLPGRGEVIEKYNEVAGEWAARGFAVLCFDPRGQGGSSREIPHRSYIKSFDTYVNDLRLLWQDVALAQSVTDLRLICAHSTGAHIALRLLTDPNPPAPPDGLILTAPFLEFSLATTPWWAQGVIRTVALHVVGRWNTKEYAPGQEDHAYTPFAQSVHTNDPARHEHWQSLQTHLMPKDYVTGGVTRAWALAAYLSNRKLRRQLGRLHPPCLSFLTPDDRIVDGPSQTQVPGTQILLPGEKHELWQAPDGVRTKMWSHIDAFLATLRTQKATPPACSSRRPPL